MTTAERHTGLLNLIQAILPAVVEQLIQPEPPKPRREHKVVSYNFGHGKSLNFDVSPPEGDGWNLRDINLSSGLAHWTRVVFEEPSDTIMSPPPDLETNPVATEEPFVSVEP